MTKQDTSETNLGDEWTLSFDGKGDQDAVRFLAKLVDAITAHRTPAADPTSIGDQAATLHFACFNFVNQCAKELGILQAQ